MGYSASAKLVVGIQFTSDDLYENIREPGCGHSHACKFCPECGKPASVSKRKLRKGCSEEGVGRLELHTPNADTSDGVLGVEVSEADGGDFLKSLDQKKIDAAFQQVRTILEPLGLWDSVKCKVWLMLYESY